MRRISRRDFGKAAMGLGALGAFHIVPRYVVGGVGFVAPSEVITRGTIGVGPQGFRSMLENKEGEATRQVAVCDVDRNNLAKASTKAGQRCATYPDFRKLLENKDVDTVHIATPDHWHSLIAISAMAVGKDVLCEKPMTRFIREGPRMIAAAQKHNRILQVNAQGRRLWTRHRKLIKSGLLGWPLTICLSPTTGFEFKVAA